MASRPPLKASATPNPATLRNARSYTRIEDQSATKQKPKRASTFQSTSAAPLGAGDYARSPPADAFEANSDDDGEHAEPHRASVDLDDLPIEVISMVDNFIDSLNAKVNPAPPNVANLSQRFQDFYGQVAERIRTHIKSLAPRHSHRDVSPAPSNSSRLSAASIFRTKAASLTRDKSKESLASGPEQQMLTADELMDRKRQRKALEAKRGHLEEAVERRLCEGIYDKIYRHHSTQDEAADSKLRSKTAALDVVGIGPLELGVDLGETQADDAAKKVQDVRSHLEAAHGEMALMSTKRYPLAKLNHLKAVHKEIVDTLAHFHPSSSADEIMPMLIYTLITLPPENLNVISDLNFIQRFRWELKLVGETAYCLTNLEAAVAFLDTVDLSTLRADESPSGPAKPSSRPATPKATEVLPPAYTGTGVSVGSSTTRSGLETNAINNANTARPLPSPSGLRAAVQLRNRRLSDLVQTPAQAIGAASDTIFTTADQGIKTISASLGDSYKFLLGKLGAVPGTVGGQASVPVPQTLEDARKLIGTPPPEAEGDDDGSGSVSDVGTDEQSLPEHGVANPGLAAKTRSGAEDRMLSIVGGRKAAGARERERERSVESVRSAASSSRRAVTFANDRVSEKERPLAGVANAAAAAQAGQQNTPVVATQNHGLAGSVLSLGSSVARLGAGMSMIRGFGRSTSTPATASAASGGPSPPPITPATATGTTARSVTGKEGSLGEREVSREVSDGGDLATAFPDIAPILPPKEMPKLAPPIQRFLEIDDPGELKLREALELLRDYRRLAMALKDMDAFESPSGR